MIGDGRRYLTALVTLDFEALAKWARDRGKALEIGPLFADSELGETVDRIVEEVNAKRSRVEHVRAYRILDHEFAVATGEMTQTLKVKRDLVIHKYQDQVEAMYAGSHLHERPG